MFAHLLNTTTQKTAPNTPNLTGRPVRKTEVIDRWGSHLPFVSGDDRVTRDDRPIYIYKNNRRPTAIVFAI